jgi:hypothetical protein
VSRTRSPLAGVEPLRRDGLRIREAAAHHDRARARRRQQRGNVVGIVLAVGVEGDHVRGATRARRRDPRPQRLRLAEAADVPQHLRAGREGDGAGAVGRAVVDDEHRAVAAGSGHDGRHGGALVVRRDQEQRGHAVLTTSATCAPPRARPCTRPARGHTRVIAVTGSVAAGSSPERAVHAAAATRTTPSPAWRPSSRASVAAGGAAGPSAAASTALSHASRARSPLAEL